MSATSDSDMGDTSAIEWTDATWNPTTGCAKVSQGYPVQQTNPPPVRRLPESEEPARTPFKPLRSPTATTD